MQTSIHYIAPTEITSIPVRIMVNMKYDTESTGQALQKQLDELEEDVKMGRPSLGVTKKVSITLPQEDWDMIQKLIEDKHASSFSDYFRNLHQTHGSQIIALRISELT